MARVQWVVSRLKNWELYMDKQRRGGMGYYTRSAFLNEVSSGQRNSVVPVNDIEADITHQAVMSLRGSHPQLYRTLDCIYLKGIGHAATSRREGVGLSTISARLETADRLLAAWFTERQERAKMSSTGYSSALHFP